MTRGATNFALDSFLAEMHRVEDEGDRLELVTKWLERNENNNLENVKRILTQFQDKDYKTALAEEWLGDERNDSFINLTELLPLLSDNIQRTALVVSWLKNPRNTKLENLKNLLSLPSLTGDSSKAFLVRTWFKDTDEEEASVDEEISITSAEAEETGTSIDFDEFKNQILSLFQSEHYKSVAVEAFFSDHNNNVPTFAAFESKVLSLFSDISNKAYIATEWFDNIENNTVENPESSLRNLKGILPLFRDETTKLEIVGEFMEKFHSADRRYEILADILTSNLINLYDLHGIIALCEMIRPKRNQGVSLDKIVNLGHKIYPNNEFLRAELLIECADFVSMSRNSETLKKFITDLKENDVALNVIEALRDDLGLEEVDILSLVKGRLNSQYESIADILKDDRKLSELLTTEGFGEVKKLFKKINADSIKLSDLFSYHDTKGDVAGFMQLIKPEVKAEIKSAFKPSDKKPYLAAKEYENLRLLTDNAIDFPTIGNLCDYFKREVKIPKIARDEDGNLTEDYQINFKSSAFEGTSEDLKKRQEELNKSFIEIIKSPITPSQDKIIAFFSAIQGEDLTRVINFSNQEKLYDFFKVSRDELAHLLRTENGLATFLACMPSLADGCVKNIGNQFRTALYSAVITDQRDRALYMLAADKIFIPILNQGGDVIGYESDPLNNNTIRSAVAVPNAMLLALRTEFYDGKKIRADNSPWKFLGKEFSDDKVQYDDMLVQKTVYELLENRDIPTDKLDDFVTNLACYIIVKNTIEKEEKSAVSADEKFFSKVLNLDAFKELRKTYDEILQVLPAELKENKKTADATKPASNLEARVEDNSTANQAGSADKPGAKPKGKSAKAVEDEKGKKGNCTVM